VRTIKLLLAYDGTEFVGWQRQATGLSVQALLEEALSRIEGASVTVAGAGRTDAGVHASGQVASAQVTLTLDGPTLQRALNAMLPPALRVLQVEDRADGFHARLSARSKTYEYRIVNGPIVSPFSHRFAWHVPYALDIGCMQQAARLLEGTHDFAAFRSTGSDVRTTVRTILQSAVDCRALRALAERPVVPDMGEVDGRLILYDVTGTGFLRHMVRAIVGTLVEIGAGRIAPLDVRGLLDQGRREAAGPTAPPAGLCLTRVDYGDEAVSVATRR
jgi:tRNA pseudouridine38-40 synthase